MITIYPLISFCTVSMDRLHHVEQTLIKNINDNEDYPNLEFVLLDYNSTDGLETWVRDKMKKYIDSGRFNYYKNPEPKYFHHSHAKNMAIRLGVGEIICCVDADNFTGEGFASYIHQNLKETDYLVANIKDIAGTYGRVAMFKKVFYASGGYNEAMEGWGYEDVDLNRRLFALGYKEAIIDSQYLKCISHDDEERSKNVKDKNFSRDISKLNIDGTFRLGGTILNNYLMSEANLRQGFFVANNGYIGCGKVYKNFGRELILEKL